MVCGDSSCRGRAALRDTSVDFDIARVVGMQRRRVRCAAHRSANCRRKSRISHRRAVGGVADVHRLGILDAQAENHRFVGLPHPGHHCAIGLDCLSVLAALHSAYRRLTKVITPGLRHNSACLATDAGIGTGFRDSNSTASATAPSANSSVSRGWR